MKILFLGPPGAGKGIISQRLSKVLNIKHFSMGDLVIDEINSQSKIGKQIKQYSDSGGLVPDEIVLALLKPHLKGDFILEGFPRRLEQAQMLDSLIKFDFIFQLDCKNEILIERTSTRRICSKCGAIYNIKTLPSKKHGICDVCKGKLIQREDEKPEVVKHRLKIYEEKTKPLLDYYKKHITKIDSSGDLDKILKNIQSHLK